MTHARIFTSKTGERAAVATLAAVTGLLPDLRKRVLAPVAPPGGKRANVEIDLEHVVSDVQADILYDISYGKKRHRVVVEAKTKNVDFDANTWERYVRLLEGDPNLSVLTLSNRMPTGAGDHPDPAAAVAAAAPDVRARLKHQSWAHVIMAIMDVASAAGPVERIVLDDLADWLTNGGFGLQKLDKLPKSWTNLYMAIKRGSVTARQSEAGAIVWGELVQFLALDAMNDPELRRRGVTITSGKRTSYERALERWTADLAADHRGRARFLIRDGSLGDRGIDVDIELNVATKAFEMTATVPLVGRGTAERVQRFVKAANVVKLDDVRIEGLPVGDASSRAARPDKGTLTRRDEVQRLGNGTGTEHAFSELLRKRVTRFCLDAVQLVEDL
jgi:hypothetical protein